MNIYQAVTFIVVPIATAFVAVVLRTKYRLSATLKSEAAQRRLPLEDQEKPVHSH